MKKIDWIEIDLYFTDQVMQNGFAIDFYKTRQEKKTRQRGNLEFIKIPILT